MEVVTFQNDFSAGTKVMATYDTKDIFLPWPPTYDQRRPRPGGVTYTFRLGGSEVLTGVANGEPREDGTATK